MLKPDLVAEVEEPVATMGECVTIEGVDGVQEAKPEICEEAASIIAEDSQHEALEAEVVTTIQDPTADILAPPEACIMDNFHLPDDDTGKEAPAVFTSKYGGTMDTKFWVIEMPAKDTSDPTTAETALQDVSQSEGGLASETLSTDGAMIKEGEDAEETSRAEDTTIPESNSESLTEVTSPATQGVQQPVVETLKTADEKQVSSAEEPTPAPEQAVIPIVETPSLVLEEISAETSPEHSTALEVSAASTSPVIEAQTPPIEQPTISEGLTFGSEAHSAENMGAKEESVIEATSLTVGDSDTPDIRALSVDALPVEDITFVQKAITGAMTPAAENTSDDKTPVVEELQTDTSPIQQLISEQPTTEAAPAMEKISVNAELSTPEEYESQQLDRKSVV